MRKGGSKAAPSPADVKAVLADGGPRHTPFKPSRSAYNRLVVRNCSHLLTMSTGERSVPHAVCANVHVEKWPLPEAASESADLIQVDSGPGSLETHAPVIQTPDTNLQEREAALGADDR
jgi:hypothetical protein